MRLEEVAKMVGGSYCRLQMPLGPALAVGGTVAGHRLGALEGGCNGSGCNARIRLRPRLLPTAFTAYCPLYEPMPWRGGGGASYASLGGWAPGAQFGCKGWFGS